MNINIAWPTIVGIIGTLLVLLAFFLLQARKLHGNGAIYQLLNAFGAAAIIVSLFYAFNLASMVLEIAWLLISIYGLVLGFRHRRESREPAAPAWSGDGPTRARKGPR
ncbi:MAG: CBU_0592 family membrane protein [Rhodanobacteraceae bacterium]